MIAFILAMCAEVFVLGLLMTAIAIWALVGGGMI